MRKLTALIMTVVLIAAFLVSCSSKPVQKPVAETSSEAASSSAPAEKVTINFYSLPYFAAADNENGSFEQQLIAAFNQLHPEITVNYIKLETGTSGEEALKKALEAKELDLLYDSAERLAGYAREGKLADLSSLFTDELKKNLPENVVLACGVSGKPYMMPLSVSPYLMAFNKEMLEKAGILNLLPYERNKDRSWTVEEYTALLAAMKEKLPAGASSGVLYAKSSSGDGATRSLMENLYGAEFVNNEYSAYTIGSSQGEQAFAWLNKTVQDGLLAVDASKTASDTVKDFADGKTAHTLLYTVGLKNNYAQSKKDNFTELLMPYPGQSGKAPTFEYALSGASVFDNGDNKRIEAAKVFIDFLANNRQWSRILAVSTGGLSPQLSKDELRYDTEFAYAESVRPLLGRHVPLTEGYDMMKTYWFSTLAAATQKDAKTADLLKAFVQTADQTVTDAIKARESAAKKGDENTSSAASSK
ncbi:ABC transporter substrate-binding protein [Acetanaerobacterium elongatum]|uniref:Multiple sugar transport system substrate-binding protein n=1 Tax=Acetanaerobacterium elongatum TaxID=258515 RepID=A0A1G9XWP9_9FIRM|nr:ABC transporter substrate-binding protein [Acetanaerobacterium elongatum]SDN00911.1 multiple sugar transport system substrate-binding protein [Acetanaerobacterium elongatum]